MSKSAHSEAPRIDFTDFQFKRDNLLSTERIRDTAFNIDHVIELQLAKVVLNSMPYLVEFRAIHGISSILNTQWNLEIVTRRYNSAKAKLTEGILEGIYENNPDLISQYLEARVYGTYGWELPKSGWRSGYEIVTLMIERLQSNWDRLRAHHDFRDRLLALLKMILATTPTPPPPSDALTATSGAHNGASASSSSTNLLEPFQSTSSMNLLDGGVTPSPSKKFKGATDFPMGTPQDHS